MLSFSFPFFLKHIECNLCCPYQEEWSLPWSVVNLPGATAFKETEAPTLRSHQMPIDPQLVGRASCPPPSWDFVWVEVAQVTAAVSPYYNFPVMPIKQSPCRNPPCWAFTIFLALSCEVSESFREGHDMCVPFKTKHSIISFLLLVDHMEIWLPTCWKGKLFWTGVDRVTDLPV